MPARELLDGLGNRLGLPDWQEESPGRRQIYFDDNLVVDFLSPDSKTIHVVHRLGKLPVDPARASELLESLLRASLGRRQIGKNAPAILTIDEKSQNIFIYFAVNADFVDEANFWESVNCFVNDAEFWRFRWRLAQPAEPAIPFGFPRL